MLVEDIGWLSWGFVSRTGMEGCMSVWGIALNFVLFFSFVVLGGQICI